MRLLTLAPLVLLGSASGHFIGPPERHVESRSNQLSVIPLPASYATESNILCLADDFTIVLDFAMPNDLRRAAKRSEERLRATTHRYMDPSRGARLFKGPDGCQAYVSILNIEVTSSERPGIVDSIMHDATRPLEQRLDLEEYSLTVPMGAKATLRSRSALGALRGLSTFEQLFYHLPVVQRSDIDCVLGSLTSRDGGSGQRPMVTTSPDIRFSPLAPYHIQDRPAFPWRGLLLDTSRHFLPIKALKRQLDVMSRVKLNVFHWHITDSNSWPLRLDDVPELATEGASSRDEIYSEEDVKDLVQYAGERGIDVVLEIDTPGHTASIAESHPGYIACAYASPWWDFAHQPPAGQLRFASRTVMDWTNRLFQSAAKLSMSPYFGTGGDEINTHCMLSDEATQNDLRRTGWNLDDALDHFTAATHGALRNSGKTPIVWDELALNHGQMPSLTQDALVAIWSNSSFASQVSTRGNRIIHAASDYFYLDCGQGGWVGKDGGGNSWCDPFKSWARILSFDPYRDIPEDQRHLVMGGQVSLWTEQTDENNLESTIWPRVAALAELFWTGNAHEGYPRSAVRALARMNDVRYRLVSEGVRAAPIQPHWCALRPGACNAD